MSNASIFMSEWGRVEQDYNRRRREIEYSQDYTPSGKTAAIDKLNSERASLRDGIKARALPAFTQAWQDMRSEYKKLISQRNETGEAAAHQWDYARLTFEQNRATGIISATDTAASLLDEFAKVQESGDRHAVMAFATTAASMLGSKKRYATTAETAQAISEMKAAAELLTDTPEKQAQRAAERDFKGRVADLYDATKQAEKDFYPSGVIFQDVNPFRELTAGVNVRRWVDKSLATLTDVDFEGWD